MAVNCEYHSNVAAWADDAVARDTRTNLPLFARRDWFARLYDHCLSPLPALIASAGNDALRVTLPLIRHDGGALHAMRFWYSFNWQPLVEGTGDPHALAALTTQLLCDLRKQAGRMILASVPAEHGVADRLIVALRRAGWSVMASPTSTNHWLDVNGRSFADWWAERPGALRSTVKRKGKKGNVAITLHRDFDADAWAAFDTIYAASWKPTESHPAFLRALAQQSGADGALRLGIAHIDGTPVAAQFWTHDAGVSSIHKLAHIDGVEAHSPGTLLSHALFEQAFDRDHATRIDFGTGDDGYKRDWMEHSAPLVTIEAFDARQPAVWPFLARAGASRLAARLRGR